MTPLLDTVAVWLLLPLPIATTDMYGAPDAVTVPELEIEIRPLAEGPVPLLAEIPMVAALMTPPWLSIVMLPPAAENAVTPPACRDVIDDVDRNVALRLPLPLL